jgi:hypothetical protein
MPDIIAILSFFILFPLCLFYVVGCNRLKGSRK